MQKPSDSGWDQVWVGANLATMAEPDSYGALADAAATQPVADGEDERAGRWKGTAKTECGIHNKASRYAQFLLEQEALKTAQEAPVVQSVQTVVATC